jgi:hypothetical protein
MRLINSGPANGHERNWKQRDEFWTMTHQHQHEANTHKLFTIANEISIEVEEL